MDKRDSVSSVTSVKAVAAAAGGEESHSLMTPHSPNATKPYSGPLRRSLVLLLDRQRREQCEAFEDSVQVHASAQVFLPSDDALEGSSSKPQLRLRAVNSHDLDDYYCHICAGSTAPFQTPRQRRSSFPPRKQDPLLCRCHELMSPAPSPSLGTTATGSQVLQLPDESLQLWLDDDSIEEERPLGLAFRRVVLRPKAECHSDMDLPSLESSATTSPAEQQAKPPIPTIAQHVPLLPDTPEMGRPLKSSAITSPAEQQAKPPIPTIAQHVPLLPDTPEMGRPLKDITLSIKTLTLQDI